MALLVPKADEYSIYMTEMIALSYSAMETRRQRADEGRRNAEGFVVPCCLLGYSDEVWRKTAAGARNVIYPHKKIKIAKYRCFMKRGKYLVRNIMQINLVKKSICLC